MADLDDFLGVPIEAGTRDEIEAIAEAEERKMTPMARLLLKLGIETWKAKNGEPKRQKKAVAKSESR